MSTAINHPGKREIGIGPGDIPRLRGSLIGNGYRWLRAPYALLDQGLREHGPGFYARLPLLGRVLITGDPEDIQTIVRCRDLVGGRGTRALRPILGDDALIVLEGRRHTQRRKLLGAAFNRESIRRCDELIDACCRQEIDALPRNTGFSIVDATRRITLRSVVRILFGQLASRREQQLCGLIDDYMNSFRNPLFLFVEGLQRDWGPSSPWGRLLRHRQRLREFVDQEIEQYSRPGKRDAQSVLGLRRRKLATR